MTRSFFFDFAEYEAGMGLQGKGRRANPRP
jgi:hypothetical protein